MNIKYIKKKKMRLERNREITKESIKRNVKK